MKRNKWRFTKAVPASVLAISMFATPFSSVVANAAPTISTQSVASVSTGTTILMNTTQITHAKPNGLDTTKPVKWTTSDPYVAYVDTIGNASGDYSGKILGVSGGSAIITGIGVDGSGAPTTVNITVSVIETQSTTNLEKVVYYYNAGDPKIPATLATTNWQTTNIPTAPSGTKFPSKSYVGYVNGESGVKWLVSKDTLIKSNDKILLGDERPHGVITGIVSDAITLYDPNLTPADQIQYLQGGRYIPQTGQSSGSGTNNNGAAATYNAKEVITNIMPDGNNGLWVLGETGNATHIVRKQMSLMGKALLQTEISRNYTDRFGFQSGSTTFSSTADMIKALMTADKDAARGTGDTDNDGLWTTMYASGEIWRYNYMKDNFGESDERTIDAKASAIRAVESIVTLGYVSGTQLKVTSKNNVNDYVYVVNSYGGNVSTIDEAKAWLAANEGKPVYVDENGKYTLDYTKKPASSGFFARSYKVNTSNNGATVPEAETWDNAWIKKKAGQTTDVNGKTVYYNVPGSFKNGTNPALKAYDTVAVPPRLTKTFTNQNAGFDADTKALDSNKVVYKATTSTDELVGHYFTLDLAYKAFKDEDPELAALIKNDMINHTNALVLNNYFQLTVNGENPAESRFDTGTIPGNGLNVPNAPTRWANMNPEYLDGNKDAWGRDADYEDGPLNAQLQLQALVVARDLGTYTPEERALLVAQGIDVVEPLDFANEYNVMNGKKASSTVNEHNDFEVRYPKTHNSTSMLDMSLQYLARYFGIAAHNGDDIGVSGVTHESYMNYSDEEEEALAYYTLSHHADKFNGDEILEGMNQWWTNEKREKNPFMTTFYAASLGALKDKGIDIGNPQVDLAGSTWQMTRIPNNFINWDVLSANRNDVTHIAPNLMADQLIPRDEVMMSKYNTNIFGTMDRRTIDSGNSRSMESSTVISMPYWITQNPEDAAYVEGLGSKITAPVNKGTESLEYPTNIVSMNPNAKYNADSHTFTINVGDSVKLDAKTTGYVRNVSWSTNAWDQAGYSNGLPTQINAEANAFQVIDLRNIATYGDEGNISPTDLSVNGEYYGAYATALKPGICTVTATVIDGFFRTPTKITYTIKVIDPNKSNEPIAPAKLDKDAFAYPTWLKNAMAETGLNTDGHKFVEVSYESSSPSDVAVAVNGDVTYITAQPANITATVVYSGMTMNGEPAFPNDSHVMTFVRTVSKNATSTVSFDSKGGSTVDSKTVGYNVTITAPTTPTRTGYTFLGWYKDEAGIQAWNFATDKVTASTVLYAKWSLNNDNNNNINKYTITFNSNGGSPVTSNTVVENTSISEPTKPTRLGYTFAGWYNEAVSKTEPYNFNTVVKGNVTLTAHWKINSYKVTFNSNGGTAVTTKIANYNTVIAKPTNPTRKGFVFVGWYKDAAFKTAWNFTSSKLTGNTILYAKWMVATPKGPKGVKVSSTSIKLTWATVSGVSGYEIVRATASNFTGKVTKTTSKGSLTATGLVKGKTYYFKVRAYTVVGKVKVYSNYTSVIKIKLS
ncbi:InlB B-repeat-containing protein [Bacillus sp. EAC]|uniref:InlB B-repeat-containing protein n=1 Tax=Bacillus sp. EAC TaxID=1978338 RepID=UPI000B44DF36|nr:InlB B-repeat-containing protein [Bacillus sp. EAC]